ncbi:MAG: hypothetical protein ACREBW_03210, partial [Candidatus Micrarchaeaceae archaeon]
GELFNSSSVNRSPIIGNPGGDSAEILPENQDYPLFIIGNGAVNGKHRAIPSDAYEVTIRGHSNVHDMDSNQAADTNNSSIHRWPSYGGRYLDNTTVAEGDVTDIPAINYGLANKIKDKADFGVVAVFHPYVGEFIICIKVVDARQQPVTLVNGFITATLKDLDNNTGDSTLTCGTITATNLLPFSSLPAPFNADPFVSAQVPSAWFIVRVSGPTVAYPSGCGALDRPFYFKVCARPW